LGARSIQLSSYLPVRSEMMWSIQEIIHIWTAVVDESEEWSSQWIFQFKQLEKIRASTGFSVNSRSYLDHGVIVKNANQALPRKLLLLTTTGKVENTPREVVGMPRHVRLFRRFWK